jgi:MFS superfamily sulfate permease-like transporter
MKLLFSALSKFIFGLLFVGLLLFLPAWTFNYPNAWLFIALLFIPMLILGIVLFIKSPDLLKKRLNANKRLQKAAFYSKIIFL